jgi:hypothetical protein
MTRTSRVKTASIALVLGLSLLTPVVAQEPASHTGKPKLSKLQGRARESRTQDVVGAMVVVQRPEEPSVYYLTTSGGDGKFFVDGLPDGDYTVRLNREGYASEVKTGIQLKYPFRAVVEVTMEPGQPDLSAAESQASATGEFALGGLIRSAAGEGLDEISVRIVRQDGAVDPRTLRTPEDGAFLFDGLSSGEWRLEVVGIGYLPVNQRLMLNADSAIVIQLVEQPPDYVPSPLELMPPEAPIAPEGFSR